MTGSLRLGSIAGIAIHIHFSWLLVFYLVATALTSRLQGTSPSLAFVWAVSALGSLTFFGSVLAHELAHSVVANRSGRMVERITLFVFGGVAHLKQEPESGKSELLIALAGPGMSLLLALVFSAAAIVSLLLPVGGVAIRSALLWLAELNAMLAVFNMIPAFPLDGGRVLRALVWMNTGRFDRATRIAAGLGQSVGFAFMGLGAVGFVLRWGGGLNWIWIAAIGWMLSAAATHSLRRVEIDRALEGVTVAEVMTTPAPAALREQPLHEAVYGAMVPRRLTEVAVIEDGRPVGLLLARDVQNVSQEYWAAMPTEHAMAPFPSALAIGAEETAARALTRMGAENAPTLYVVDGEGRLVGTLSQHDIAQAASIGMMARAPSGGGSGYRYPIPLAPPPPPAPPPPEARDPSEEPPSA